MAYQLGLLVPESTDGRGTGVPDDAGLVDHRNAVVAILDERAEPGLVLAQRFGGGMLFTDVEVHHHGAGTLLIERNRRRDHVEPADGAAGLRAVHPLESFQGAGENRLEAVAHAFGVRRTAFRARAADVKYGCQPPTADTAGHSRAEDTPGC